MRNLYAIIQTTDLCNLRCTYCYKDTYLGNTQKDASIRLSNPITKESMSFETITNAVNNIIDAVDENGFITLLYHGGEPLVRGIEFYNHTQNIFKNNKKNQKVRLSMQSNGTLIDDKVADFIASRKIHIGLSIDGPKEIHDENRIDRYSAGSFDKTMAGVQRLRKRNINPGAVTVITKNSLGKEKEIYTFFNKNGIHVKLNPVDITGRTDEERNRLEVTAEEYGDSLIRFFDAWFYDKNVKIQISNFMDIGPALINGRPSGCLFMDSACGTSYIALKPNGDIYPCSRFTNDLDFKAGNINTDSIKDIFKNKIYSKFSARKELSECMPCEYKKICNGGCSSSAYSHNDTIMSKDYYCTSFKMLFSHMEERMHTELVRMEEKI